MIRNSQLDWTSDFFHRLASNSSLPKRPKFVHPQSNIQTITSIKNAHSTNLYLSFVLMSIFPAKQGGKKLQIISPLIGCLRVLCTMIFDATDSSSFPKSQRRRKGVFCRRCWAIFHNGISVDKPQRTGYLCNLSGYFYRSQDNNLPAYILLWVFEETRTDQPKEWKVSLPRVSSWSP